MDLSYAHFFEQMSGNPLLTMAVVLTLGVILVNGWTDAPNAIATCVVTRCMSPKEFHLEDQSRRSRGQLSLH